MNELVLLSPSHIITVALCITAIIYLPKFFVNSSDAAKKYLAYSIIFLLLLNQVMDFYREACSIRGRPRGGSGKKTLKAT